MNALLDDVLARDELAGGARPQLLHRQASHHLLVRRRALRARTRQELKNQFTSVPTCDLNPTM